MHCQLLEIVCDRFELFMTAAAHIWIVPSHSSAETAEELKGHIHWKLKLLNYIYRVQLFMNSEFYNQINCRKIQEVQLNH